MNCPKCGGLTRAPRTNPVEGGTVVARIRVCLSKKCQWSFLTEERVIGSTPRPPVTAGDRR